MIVLRLLALALFAVVPAHAQTALRDGVLQWVEKAVPAQPLAAQMLEREFAQRYGPRPQAAAAAGGTMDAETRQKFLAQYDTAIKQFEATLAKLKADDPQRAPLQSALETMRKARDDFAAGRTAGASAPAATAAPPVRKAAAPIGVSAALANARALVQRGAGEKALADLARQPELKTARGAAAVAAAAALADKPVAALAALLIAHEREPNNPTHLVNLAGQLSALGMGWEALASLDAADALKTQPAGAMGLDGTAIALNNRGNALLAVGKAAEAEAVLRRAAELEPLLAEARTNLAMALRAQGKNDEAARSFAVGTRRNPTPPAPSPPPANQAGQSGSGAQPPAAGAEGPVVILRPAAEVYDLSRGISGHLPTIRYGKTAREHEALIPRLEAMIATLEARDSARRRRLQELAAQPRSYTGPGADLSAARAGDIIGRLSIVSMRGEKSLAQSWRFVEEAFSVHANGGVNFAKRHLEGSGGADVQPKLDLQTPRGRYEQALEPLGERRAKEQEACGSGSGAAACREAVIKKYDNIYCNESEKAYLDWRPHMLRLDGAVEDHFDQAYKLMTGLAANISDPVNHELALLQIEAHSDYVLRFYVLQPAITPKFSPLFAYVALCEEPGTPEEPGEADLKAAAKCDLVSGSNKVSVDLLVAGVSFNCEKVSVEVSKGQIVQGFVEVEYEFTGRVTVTIGGGLGVEAGPVNVGVKGGCYVSVDTNTGSFVDAGIKGSAGATTSGSVGATSELEGSISFIAG